MFHIVDLGSAFFVDGLMKGTACVQIEAERVKFALQLSFIQVLPPGQSRRGPLRSATRMQHGFQSINPVAQCQ